MTRFDRCAKELGHDHDQDLRQRQIDDAEFFAQYFAVRLNLLGGVERNVFAQGQSRFQTAVDFL